MKKIFVLITISILLFSGILAGAERIENNEQSCPEEYEEDMTKDNSRLDNWIFRNFYFNFFNPIIENIIKRILSRIHIYPQIFDDECLVSLPDTPVYADIEEIWGSGPLYSYLSTELSGITGVYDVENKVYPGWCLDYHTPLPFDDFVEGDPVMPIAVMLYSSYCPPDDPDLQSDGWDEVNYILNHKHPDAGWNDVHVAINQFVGFGDVVSPPAPSSIAGQMVAAAQAKDPGWMPGVGDVVAVIVDPIEDAIPIDPPFVNDWGEHYRWQYTIIEVPIPEDYEGLTPGFWKNRGYKKGLWEDYSPTDTIVPLFNLPYDPWDDNPKRPVDGDDTLLDALNYKGGEKNSGMAQTLLRAAVAALLNAAHPEVNYPITEAEIDTEIIQRVNDALLTEDRDTMEMLKNEFDSYNNLGADEWW
jgi:hypothetical protein